MACVYGVDTQGQMQRRDIATYSALRQVAEWLNRNLRPLTLLKSQIQRLKNIDKLAGCQREKGIRQVACGRHEIRRFSFFSRQYVLERRASIAEHNLATGRPKPGLERVRAGAGGTCSIFQSDATRRHQQIIPRGA